MIYPPVNTDYYVPNNQEEADDFYLVVSRLVSYKRIDLALEVFNQLEQNLVVIGDGEERKELEEKANDNIEFLGRVSDGKVKEHFQRCKAFIFLRKEDFGVTPVEVTVCGRSVVTYGEGGDLEIVIDFKKVIIFKDQNVNGLKDAVVSF